MARKDKKYATESTDQDQDQDQVNAPIHTSELEQLAQPEGETKPKKERAPRIVRNRYVLIGEDGAELKFTHYALSTRRAITGQILLGDGPADFIVTKSTDRAKTEERAYSYFKLPEPFNHTGYVAQELLASASYTIKEMAPAAPFGRTAAPTPAQAQAEEVA